MRKIVWTLSSVAVLVLGWYLFIRPFEFEVNFDSKTLPGDIIQTIKIWDRSMENATVEKVDSIYSLTQKITWRERSYVYTWNFELTDDSTTHVNIQITEPGRKVRNKLLVPFTNQYIEQDAKDIAQQFYNILKEHLRITRVKMYGETEIESSFCVCSTLETRQIEKANGMMKDFDLLTTFITENHLAANGKPIVQIMEWNHNQDKLKFDFCFPIAKTDSLPSSQLVFYKEVKGGKVLKAEYFGNYIASDRAWYVLQKFAKDNGYEVSGLPIEQFFNNPNLGLKEQQWRADIYLPVK
jgi:effector-binding domain-containing protein